jgi:hypothetical protein
VFERVEDFGRAVALPGAGGGGGPVEGEVRGGGGSSVGEGTGRLGGEGEKFLFEDVLALRSAEDDTLVEGEVRHVARVHGVDGAVEAGEAVDGGFFVVVLEREEEDGLREGIRAEVSSKRMRGG